MLVFLTILIWGVAVIEFCEPTKCDVTEAVHTFNNNSNIGDIVVSFTTMPKRMHTETFKKVVCTMMQQSLRPKEIRLNLPFKAVRTQEEYHVPEWLKSTPIIIVRCEDLGPATKYIPTLQHFDFDSNQMILVCDDDMIMPLDLVQSFETAAKNNPEACVAGIGYQIRKVPSDWLYEVKIGFRLTLLHATMMSVVNWKVASVDVTEGEGVDIVTGWGCYVLRPKFVDIKGVLELDKLPKEAFFVDDVVISANLKTKAIVVPNLVRAQMSYQDAWDKLLHMLKLGEGKEHLFSLNSNRHNDDTMYDFYAEKWGKNY